MYNECYIELEQVIMKKADIRVTFSWLIRRGWDRVDTH